jgi:predicted nucleic acid-binding protein
MTDKVFVDSNVWIYLFAADDGAKSRIVNEYISQSTRVNRLVISYQVVNEVCCVLKKKKYTESEIRRVADDILESCEVHGYSRDIIFLASDLREKYSFSFWDSHIVASALAAQCGILASEDMSDGLRIDNLIIKNVLKHGTS